MIAVPAAAADIPAPPTPDCAGVSTAVLVDASSEPDLYAAYLLAGVVGTGCIVDAGERTGPLPESSAALLAGTTTGYVVGGTAAVPASKLTAGATWRRAGGADRWATLDIIGRAAADPTTLPFADATPPDSDDATATPDCADATTAVLVDASSEPDLYAAYLLAGVVGTGCIADAGERTGPLPDASAVLLDGVADGYVVGGTAAVPATKLDVDASWRRAGGSDRWATLDIIGAAASDPEKLPTAVAAPYSAAHDRDGDGLIEVDNLAQLDAIRWDLDGDGISDSADYAAAFPDAGTGMMCPVARCAGYELTTNLDFDANGNGEADEGDVYWNGGGGWLPIGKTHEPFVATFDGGGHTIFNLYIRRSPNVGLFGVLGSGSTVLDIGLADIDVEASGFGAVGALAGIGYGVIEDSSADGLVAGCVDQIGGLVGFNHGEIVNSRSAVDVESVRRTSSGPHGSRWRTCYASGGGLVGENNGTIADSHSTSAVSGFTDNFGGLAGVNSGVIAGSYASGSVSGNGFADVGGLVGENDAEGKIVTSYATGDVSGQGDNFGGLAGVNSGVIAGSYASGSVSGNGFADVGGLVGENDAEGKIVTSYATGDVSGQGDNFGGLAGVNSGVIAGSYATGSVSGNGFADVGGLVGDNLYTGVITAAYAQGSVSGRADRYGGLIGSNEGVVTVCFSTGAVPQSGGGLIGSNGNYGAVSNCYWDTETSDLSDSAGGDGKTTAELQSPTGYTGAYADWNVDLDSDGSSDDPWLFGSATEYPALNLGTLDIDHDNLRIRPPLESKANEALCLAVSNGQTGVARAQIEAGVDVNDTCQTTRLWYNDLTPLAIAKRRGRADIEAILIQAGAVDSAS